MADAAWRVQRELQRDLNAAKRRALDVADARALEDQWFREAADELAAVLARLHDDEVIWASLQAGQATLAGLHAAERPDVRMVLDLDFVPFLEAADYEDPPPVEAYAWSFKLDVVRALHDPTGVDLDRLRENVRDLARRLGAEGPDGQATRRDAWVAALRHGAAVAGRAAVIAAVATSATVVAGPLLAPLGAGVAAVVLEAAKGASAAALEDVVPQASARQIGRITRSTDPFDVAATRLAHWMRPERVAAQDVQLQLLRAAVDGNNDASASRLHRQQVRWASGALATALLAGDAGRTTSPHILQEVDALADVLATLLDALTELDLDAAAAALDRLAGPGISVLDYDAHDVPEPIREQYRHYATESPVETLDWLALNGVAPPVDPGILTEDDDIDGRSIW